MSETLPATLLAIAALLGIGAIVLVCFRIERWWSPALAVLRGGVQLALLGFVLTGVLENLYWVAAALLVMFVVAAITSTRRASWSLRRLAAISVAILAGVSVALTIIFTSGAIGFEARYVLALGGILIGNAMTIATLTARRLTQTVHERWGEVEAWLSLGFTFRQATTDFARFSIAEALVPSTDQTKTAGLVALPGAFIGAIFGGLDPLEAGRFQILVLAGILASGAITAVITAMWLAPMIGRPVHGSARSARRRQNA